MTSHVGWEKEVADHAMSALSLLTGEGSAAPPESHRPVQRAAAAEGVVPLLGAFGRPTRRLAANENVWSRSRVQAHSLNVCACLCVFLQWADFLKMGEDMTDQELNAVIGSLRANECCSLIYTSGTTGNPKGVMLSHDNVSAGTQLSSPCKAVLAENLVMDDVMLINANTLFLLY